MGFLAHAITHSLSLSLSLDLVSLCQKLLQPKTHSNQKPEMGKQKVVIKVPMNEPPKTCWGFESPFHPNKSQTKAMKIAVGVPGVESAALAGQDKCQLEVVGDGIDAVGLTTLLRKNVGYSELVSVGPVEKKDGGGDQKKNEATAPVPVVGYYPYPYLHGAGHVYEIRDPNDNCSIM